MPAPPEHPERREMRRSLRNLERHITGLQPDRPITMFPEIDQIRFLPLALDEGSKDRPAYFSLFPECWVMDPDNEFDEERSQNFPDFTSSPEDSEDSDSPSDCPRWLSYYFLSYIGSHYYSKSHPKSEVVWSSISTTSRGYKDEDMHRFVYPQFRTDLMEQVKKGPYAHLKSTIFNCLNADDKHILQGELLAILRHMIAHLRRARFIDHMVAPIMAFSFVGPQHARVIEAYMDGHTVVVRPTKLYDLRTKDEAVLKTFAQWYFGKPRAPTGHSQ